MADKGTGSAARRGLREATRKRIQAVLPPAFRSHLKASIREAFLAFESLLDEAVKSLEKEGKRPSGRKSRKVKAE